MSINELNEKGRRVVDNVTSHPDGRAEGRRRSFRHNYCSGLKVQFTTNLVTNLHCEPQVLMFCPSTQEWNYYLVMHIHVYKFTPENLSTHHRISIRRYILQIARSAPLANYQTGDECELLPKCTWKTNYTNEYIKCLDHCLLVDAVSAAFD